MKRLLAFSVLVVTTLISIAGLANAHSAQSAPDLDWYIQTVAQPGQIGNRGLQLDSAGHPHIAYVAQGTLYHAWHDGTVWQIETVDATLDDSDAPPSLALDHMDQPCIAYRSNHTVKYAYWTSGIWTIQTVDSGEVYQPSLVLDAANRPHLSYDINNVVQPSGYAYAVKYAVWTGSAWQVQTVEQGINPYGNYTVFGTVLAIDSSGAPHLSYAVTYVPGMYPACIKYCVKYVHWTGSAWNTQIVEQGGPDVTPISVYVIDLVLDGAERPHLLFGRRVGGAIYTLYLVYTKWTGSNWATHTIDSGGVGGGSLALDTDDNPNVSYANYGVGRTIYAHWEGNTWSYATVSELANATSLAVDAQDGAHIAFSSLTMTPTLKYAQQLPRLALTKQAFLKQATVGDKITYTLTLSGPAGHHIRFLDPVPENLEYVSDSVTPPVIYSPTLRAILWQGTLPTGTLAISFQAALTNTGGLSSTTPVVINTAWLTDTLYGNHSIATTIVNGWDVYLPSITR